MDAILGRFDAITASLGLLRDSVKMKKGTNTRSGRLSKETEEEGRELDVLEKPEYRRTDSFDSDVSEVTIVGKDTAGAF